MTRQEVYALFGRQLAAKRENAGLSQADLARVLGLSRTSITNMESGRQPIQLHQLYLIAEALGVSVLDLLPATGRSHSPNTPDAYLEALSRVAELTNPLIR